MSDCILIVAFKHVNVTSVLPANNSPTNHHNIFFYKPKFILNLLVQKLFFLILAHPVYKMWIKQEPNTLESWNKLHFEEKETESIFCV